MKNQEKEPKRKMKSLEVRNVKWGLLLLSPWIIGMIFFFIKPLIEIIIYSFNEVSLDLTGISMKPVGVSNYIYALTSHASFNQGLITTFALAIPDTIIIIIFSLLAAVMLNGEFKGRLLARAVFFLPIIMATDLITVTIGGGAAASMDMVSTAQGSGTEGMLGIVGFLLQNTDLPKELVLGLLSVVSNVFDTITQSGVQILIFLAGLQTITPSMYEVAKIEGATAYETFWKVTIPMLSPLILTCAIYTLTDAFLRSDLKDLMQTIAFNQGQYGLSAAMSVIFLIGALVIISIVAWLIGRKVFYYD